MGEPVRHRLKVRHYEADPCEHVNHANCVHSLEVGRLDGIESLGISLREMRRQGYLIVARDLSIRFHAPALPGETLEIITRIGELGAVRSIWVQEIREVESQRLVVTAEVAGVFLTEDGRPVRIPPAFHDKLTALYVPDAPLTGRAENLRSP